MLNKKDVKDVYYKRQEEALKSKLKEVVEFLEKDGIVSYIENEVKNTVAKGWPFCELDITIPNYEKMNEEERCEAAKVYFGKIYSFLDLMGWYGGELFHDGVKPPYPFANNVYITINFSNLFSQTDKEVKYDLRKTL